MIPRRSTTNTLCIAALATALGLTSAGCCKNVAPDPAAEAEAQFREEVIRQIAIPAAMHAESWLDGPIIQLKGEDISVDGTPCARLGSGMGTDECRILLRNKGELWKQLNPGRAFPGTVVLVAGRDTPGEKVDAVAGFALKAGFPSLHVVVHQVKKGKLSATSLGIAKVHLLALTPGDASAEPEGLRLVLGPANMAMMSWKKGGGETDPGPVALTEEKRADGTIHLPGLVSAVGRNSTAHQGDKRVAVISGIQRVRLEKVVAIADVFSDPQTPYQVFWLVVPR
jgi:hypothetical protein